MLNRSCAACNQVFDITTQDQDFYRRIPLILGDQTIEMTYPTLCPPCRSQRRMTWRNERSLYSARCRLCMKDKVSSFSPNSPYTAYCKECLYSDGWDALSYGRSYNFSLSFHENMRSLMSEVPLMMLFQSGINENCDYINCAGTDCKNCYMIFNSGRSEDCYHSRGIVQCKNCMDLLIASGNELCYECTNTTDCYRLVYSENCTQCSESAFLFNCRRCTNCIGCSNLVGKEYMAWGKQCTPEEFHSIRDALTSTTVLEDALRRFSIVKQQAVHRATNSMNAEECTGDYITNSKNCTDSYEVARAEDCRFLQASKLCKDSYDLFGYGYDSELLYECLGVGLSTSAAFCFTSSSVSNSYYCLYCQQAPHCFGCVSLFRKSYCIFNKQYSEEEYNHLTQKIVDAMKASGEWGEFLPPALSPYGYNQTIAQEYFPLTKDEVERRGWTWNTDTAPMPKVIQSVEGNLLPDHIDDIPDDVLQWAIICPQSHRPWKMMKQELALLRQLRVSFPRCHPDARHARRQQCTNPCKLWNRPCASCRMSMTTTYSPERTERVYCNDCYAKEFS